MEEDSLICHRGEIVKKEGLEEFYVPDSADFGLYDWGAPFSKDVRDEGIVQVQFKNSRRGFYINRSMLSVHRGDIVAVAAVGGHDIGIVALTGWLARRSFLQLQCQNPQTEPDPPLELYRKATQQDILRWVDCVDKEFDIMLRARVIAQEMNLQMKISDVEYQGDGSKLLFYYSAEQRVDFRELVRVFASEFRVRIEMRQIGPRQEAARIGGIGSCGREICCGGWLRNFSSVTTSTIKLQDLTPNPQKQAGQCGKLKCCLNFEVAVYEEAKRKIPRVKAPLLFEDGLLYHVKNDLFRDCMYFATTPKATDRFIMLTCEQVEQVLALNHAGQKGDSILAYRVEEEETDSSATLGYGNVIEEESLTRFDKSRKKNKNKSRNKQQLTPKEPNTDKPPVANNTAKQSPNASEQTSGKDNKQQPKKAHQQPRVPNNTNTPNNRNDNKHQSSNNNTPRFHKQSNRQQQQKVHKEATTTSPQPDAQNTKPQQRSDGHNDEKN